MRQGADDTECDVPELPLAGGVVFALPMWIALRRVLEAPLRLISDFGALCWPASSRGSRLVRGVAVVAVQMTKPPANSREHVFGSLLFRIVPHGFLGIKRWSLVALTHST